MAMDGNRLGDAMYNAMMAIGMEQGSGESDDLGRKRMKAIAAEIIREINGYATIAPLSTTSTIAGDPPHIHNPITVESTGKIS